MSLAYSSGWQWREKKIEQQSWKMMDLPNCSGWPWRRTMQEKQDGEDGRYHTAQVGPGDRGRKKSIKKWI